jgi:hypothetical protein
MTRVLKLEALLVTVKECRVADHERRHVATVWLYILVANLPLWVEYRFWIPAVPFVFISAAQGAHFLARKFQGSG